MAAEADLRLTFRRRTNLKHLAGVGFTTSERDFASRSNSPSSKGLNGVRPSSAAAILDGSPSLSNNRPGSDQADGRLPAEVGRQDRPPPRPGPTAYSPI